MIDAYYASRSFRPKHFIYYMKHCFHWAATCQIMTSARLNSGVAIKCDRFMAHCYKIQLTYKEEAACDGIQSESKHIL